MSLPDDLPMWGGWALAALGALWAIVRRLLVRGGREELLDAMRSEFLSQQDGDGIGARLKHVEVKQAAQEGRVAALERVDETHNFQVAAQAERLGKMEGRLEKTEHMLEETLRKVESRLGNIEGQLSIIVQRRDA
jgi:hypothetical protein